MVQNQIRAPQTLASFMMKSKNIWRGINEIPRGHDGELQEESGDVLGPFGNHAKNLDLIVSLTCLREKRERAFGRCVRFGAGGRERDTPYKSNSPTPPFYASADCPRYPDGLSASEIFAAILIWNCL